MGSTSTLMMIGWCPANMSSGEERNVSEWSVLCFPDLWTVRTLISRTDAYAGSGRPTLNFIECFELGSLRSDTAKPLHQFVSLGRKQLHRMYTDYVAGLAWMWTEICYCILCLSIILFDTSKASGNLTFVLKQSLILSNVLLSSLSVVWVPWRSVEQITLDLYQLMCLRL